MEHPHHTLFIIFALVNANKDKAFCKTPASKDVPGQSSPPDLVRRSGQYLGGRRGFGAVSETELSPPMSICCRSARKKPR